MGSIITTFHLDWQLLIAQVINFSVVAVILWWFGFRPLANLLEDRSKKVERGLADAAAAANKLEQAEIEAQKILAKARVESQAALAAAAAAAARLRAEELAKAKEAVEKTILAGRAALAAEKNEIMKDIRSEAADLVIEAAKSVLKDTKLIEINRSLADKALTQVK